MTKAPFSATSKQLILSESQSFFHNLAFHAGTEPSMTICLIAKVIARSEIYTRGFFDRIKRSIASFGSSDRKRIDESRIATLHLPISNSLQHMDNLCFSSVL